MNIQIPSSISALKDGIGRDVPRKEDAKLTRGHGRYTDDVNLPGETYGYFVRSTVAHGKIRGIDTTAARGMPGVLGIFTAADIAKHKIGGIKAWIPPNTKHRDGSPLTAPVRPPLADGRVRFAGEPIALVVAETLTQARDAAEAVTVDIEPLPAVVTVDDAMAPGAIELHDGYRNNIAFDYSFGDARAVDEAFARAAHITRAELCQNRIVVNTMETRSAIASYDQKNDKWTLNVVGQGVLLTRNMVANDVLGVPVEKVRIITDNVGGSFGLKGALFVEYPSMMCASRVLGRPVKWTDDRSGSFLSDHHSRTHAGTAELALDKDGRFLACRFTGTADAGAFLVMAGPILNAGIHMAGVYQTPALHCAIKLVYTNTGPIAAFRGAGRPEGTYFMERLVDIAAAEMGIDRLKLRRLNFIRPNQMPYKNAAGTTYDCGEFDAVLKEALMLADVDGFAKRRKASLAHNKRRGLGFSTFIEVSGAGSAELGGVHFERDGTVTIVAATHDHGQGHGSPFAQVLSEKLGIPFDKIKLVQNDSDLIRMGGFTGGSRSAIATGSALIESSALIIERGRKLAAHLLEAGEQDIQFAEGRFKIAGTDRSIGLMELAARLHAGLVVPDGMPTTLDVHQTSTGNYPSTYPNGCHIAEVEIDVATGNTEVVKYTSVDDCGNLINPMIVDGQIHGGVVMGIGQALMEQAIHDDEGQLLTGSFMDYAMPRADSAPSFTTKSHPVPTKTNPLGVKGCGEAGVSGALAAVMNAVDDALKPLGIKYLNMPATAARVWQAIQGAGK